MKTFEITSLQNDLIKYAFKLQDSKFRKAQKQILVDGYKTIDGLILENIKFEYLFLKKDSKYQKYRNVENIVFVNDEILKKISTTKTPTDVVGIIQEPEVDFDVFKGLDKIALIDGIKDAGNLGTIIRSAVAFSFDGIILFGDCVDLYNSKVIRATAQNIFKIPIFSCKDINLIKQIQKTHKLYSTVVNTKNDFMDFSFDEKFVLALGSEANGLSEEIIKMSDEKVTFSMDNNVESLNLGVCASIAFALIKLKNKI